MAFFGADGLDHQIKHLKTQLAQKGWWLVADPMCRQADSAFLRFAIDDVAE